MFYSSALIDWDDSGRDRLGNVKVIGKTKVTIIRGKNRFDNNSGHFLVPKEKPMQTVELHIRNGEGEGEPRPKLVCPGLSPVSSVFLTNHTVICNDKSQVSLTVLTFPEISSFQFLCFILSETIL